MTPPRRLPSLCYKTRMCKFFALGACDRGDACTFAHRNTDLNPMPDLSRTQVCPVLINTGRCEDPECSFAHNAGELRKGPFGFANQQIIRRRERAMEQMNVAVAQKELVIAATAPTPQEVLHALPQPVVNIVQPQEAAAPPVPEEMLAPPPAKETSHGRVEKVHKKRAIAFKKTRMCVFHQAGRCFKRENCNFAHSRDELRKVPEGSHRAPSNKALCALFDQSTPEPVAKEEAHLTVKNTFLAFEMPKEAKPSRRSHSCPAPHSDSDEEHSTVSSPRDMIRKTSAPACIPYSQRSEDAPDAEDSWPPLANADGREMPQKAHAHPASAARLSKRGQNKLGQTPPMLVQEACVDVPGMTAIPKNMGVQMMVPVCALQQDCQLVETQLANMTDLIVFPQQMIGC